MEIEIGNATGMCEMPLEWEFPGVDSRRETKRGLGVPIPTLLVGKGELQGGGTVGWGGMHGVKGGVEVENGRNMNMAYLNDLS